MNGMRWNDVEMLYLLWALPFLVALFAYAGYRRRQALEVFAEAKLLPRLNTVISRARRRVKAILALAAFVFIVLGLARPAWNPIEHEVTREGRDVVFILDVSKSMLAEDLAPNRIERAKIAIRDCLEVLQGDRIGLVAFAGTAAVKCPLTRDYGFFRLMLDDIQAGSIARGGTMIGDAVRKAIDEAFDDQEKGFKDIILITDGEDHDSFPEEAAKEAGDRKIRIIAIGIGEENEGRRIPITDELGRRTFMKYQGREVWSKLDADTLRKMVNVTPGGQYLNVATGTIDLGQVYLDLVVQAEKKQLEAKTIQRYEEKFQIFLVLAFALLCVEVILSERMRKSERERRNE